MGRGKPPAPALPMTGRQYDILEQESRRRTTLLQYHRRIPILLRASKGESNSQIARELDVPYNTVLTWRRRWEADYTALLVFEEGLDGKGVSDHELLEWMLGSLHDLPRSGTPRKITLAQEQQIVALACEKPEDYGVAMTNWTHEMLAKVAVAQSIVESISTSYVGVILKKKRVATA